MAFVVGTCEYHFTPQELWVWTPATDALSKLIDISEEAAGAYNKGPALTVEWVDSDPIRLWNGTFGWDTPCGWQDIILRAGADGFTVAEIRCHSIAGGRRVGSRGANAVVVQQQNGVLHAYVLLVGPEGETLVGQADAYYPPEYENWTFDLCTKGALPYVVLREPYVSPDDQITHLQLVALP